MKRMTYGLFLSLVLLLGKQALKAQTALDGVMMNKYQFCNGVVYMHDSWDQYWEGTLKRENLNLGTVSTQSVGYMANYGITNRLNVMAGASYVWTKASAGQFAGMNGIQDLNAAIKWKFLDRKIGRNQVGLMAVGHFSTPLTNYVADYLPFSIGMGSTNLGARMLVDYKRGIFTVTGSGAYFRRSNVEIDRDSYYAHDEMIYSNKVDIPDMAHVHVRAGIRSRYLVTELFYDNMITLGGDDIRLNAMPFLTNQMNATRVGLHAKYTLPFFTHVELVGGGSRVLQGRNVGQSTTFYGGVFYLFNVRKPSTKKS